MSAGWKQGVTVVVGAALCAACGPLAPATEPDQPRAQSTKEGVQHVPDDPASCVSPAARAENEWTHESERQLFERMASLSSCVPKGTLIRDEHLDITLNVLPDRTVTGALATHTTLPDCSIADCFMKAFAGSSPPGAPLHPEAQFVSVDAVLRPEAAPRVSAPDEKFGWRNIATTCRGPNYDASGRLPPEKIQAVVRSAYGNFRKCYDHGLARSPTLRGRTAIRFVIERDGTTANPVIQDNTLPDCAVATCVRDSFAKLAYPAPEGGTITVTYPITLEPEP